MRRSHELSRRIFQRQRWAVPTGKVKWYDAEKGFGFLSDDEGGDVFLHANALPPGVTTLKGGTRVEFGIVEGRRGRRPYKEHGDKVAQVLRFLADQLEA